MKRAILSINFNGSRLLQKQTETYKRFISGSPDIFIGDNSVDLWWRKSNEQICKSAKINYIPISFNEGDPSRHHGMALNHCLHQLKKYDQVLILDHDIFPFTDSHVFEDYAEYDFAGIHQLKDGGVVYLAPIFLLINGFKSKIDSINLMPVKHLDTGGGLHELLKTSKVKFVNEFLHTDLDYAIVNDTFMHFIKGSGWDRNPNHEQRLNKLFDKLDYLITSNTISL